MKFTFYDPDKEPKKPKVSEKPSERSAPMAQPAPVQPTQRRGIVLDWIRELDWSKNPFTQLDPIPAHDFLVGQEHSRQVINVFFIRHSKFGVITGDTGSGKTFMLHWIKEELEYYKDRYLVYFFDASTPVDAFIAELTKPYNKLLSKYRGKTPEDLAAFLSKKAPQRLVMLVDDADENEALRLYCKALVQQADAAVIVSAEKPAAFLKDELNVKLHALSAADAEAILEKRIEAVGGSGIEPFRKKLVEELWKVAKQNPVQFFNYCNETAMKLALKQVTLPVEKEEKKESKKEVNDTKKKKVETVVVDEKKEEKKQRSPYDDLIEGLIK